MNTRALMTAEEARAAMMARPEFGSPPVVRACARFFGLANEEGLAPVEMAVAWQRIARTILRESLWKVATGSLLAGLCEELLAEMAEHRATAQRVGLDAEEVRPTEHTENTEGGKV
jgi:hypothetical protein